jgi:hypothetical protein
MKKILFRPRCCLECDVEISRRSSFCKKCSNKLSKQKYKLKQKEDK